MFTILIHHIISVLTSPEREGTSFLPIRNSSIRVSSGQVNVTQNREIGDFCLGARWENLFFIFFFNFKASTTEDSFLQCSAREHWTVFSVHHRYSEL